MRLSPGITRPLAAAALVAVAAALVVRADTPPDAAPATAPDTTFSAARAMRHVRAIAVRPHPTGSADHARVRGYILSELRALGLAPQVQETVGVGTRYAMAGTVWNIIVRIPGTRVGGRAVLLASHYDSQGATPGAGDATSGVATLLETARALRAGRPLASDVILLFTDGEEPGLLGAAAFVREHPWARDVAMMLNFEARGTHGRSFMFETGAGNLDAAQVLRGVPDVSASSLMVLAYRVLPNDTDLSELSALGVPAMNFAFIDGVERYHTARDDIAHLDARSLQHHGAQALALARAFASDTLPRPRTGDAVFFDVPALGLVVYPETWAWPLALLGAALAMAAVVRGRQRAGWWRDVLLGAAAAVAGVVLAALAGGALAVLIESLHARMGWEGAPTWRGVYQAAVLALAVACAAAGWTLVRRRASGRGAHAGVLILWSALTVAATAFAPGASFLLAWPLLFAAAAALVSGTDSTALRAAAAQAVATVAALVLLLPIIYLLGTALGIALTGAAAAALLTSLGVLLIMPSLEWIAGSRRWLIPGAALATAIAMLLVGAATVRPSDDYPIRGAIEYRVDAGTDSAALPRAMVLTETTSARGRDVTIRVVAPESTWVVRMASGAGAVATEVAGRAIETGRYRYAPDRLHLGYVAPPDTGFIVTLAVPGTAPLELELVAQRAGVPDSVRRASEAAAHEVPSHEGDVTLTRTRVQATGRP